MTASDQAGLSRRTLVGIVVLSAACYAVMLFKIYGQETRLYWEYGGRILGRAFTAGFVEWVQHRIGSPLPIDTAVPIGRALAPYTDFPCEYPPGVLLLFAAVRSIFDNLSSFSVAFHILIATCGVVTSVVGLALVRTMAPAMPERRWTVAVGQIIAVTWPLLIGSFSVDRFDIVAALFASGGLLIAIRARPALGSILIGLGGAIKLWPVVVGVLLAVAFWSVGRRAVAIVSAAGGSIGMLVPHAAMLLLGTKLSDTLSYLGFLAGRPPQLESLAANLIVLAKHLDITTATSGFDFGSHNVYSPLGGSVVTVFTLLNLAGILALVALLYIQGRRLKSFSALVPNLIAASGAAVALIIVCSRVFSGEYLAWLFPFALAMSTSRSGGVAVICLALAALSFKILFGQFYGDFLALALVATLICLGKNLLVLVVGGIFARQIAMTPSPGSVQGQSQTASTATQM